MENQNEQIEINLIDLFYHLKKKFLVIVSVTLVFAIAAMAFTAFVMDEEYTATTRIYVLSRSSDTSISSSDYSVSNYMVSDYEVLITGKNVTGKVVEQLNLDMSVSELTSKISVEAIQSTRVLQIKVVDTDPQRAADIANCVREIATVQMKEIMSVDVVNLVYEAEVPEAKSGPSLTKNTVLAAALGFIASVAVLIVCYLMDDTIRTEEDVEHYLGLSVLGVIPASTEMGSLSANAVTAKKVGARKPAGAPRAAKQKK